MSVLHRALFTWFTFLVFLILLVLRIDNRTQWNWFVVFIPIWIFNAILLMFSAFDTVSSCKSRAFNRHIDVSLNLYLITIVILKMVFEIMLCLKLELPSLNLTTDSVPVANPLFINIPCYFYGCLSQVKVMELNISLSSSFLVLFFIGIHFFNLLPRESFTPETSVWCMRGSKESNICRFKNICYDLQFKTFLLFLSKSSVIKGFKHYTELQNIQLSSIQPHNKFYANLSVIDSEKYKVTKPLKIYSKILLFSRFKPNNIMHSVHDDLFPVFLTLESICLGDISCMKSYSLMFHDDHPKGPFFKLYNLFSKHPPIISKELNLNSNDIFCFEEMLTGLVVDGLFYQYGFKRPHGPLKSTEITQFDISRFITFIKNKLEIHERKRNFEVLLFKRQKNRKILNVSEVKKMIESAYQKLNNTIRVKLINLDLYSHDLTALIKTISGADGLIGMHGAEMILSLFMRPGSYVFELFPFGINPDTVSFIKPISELEGSNFKYFPWKNLFKNNSVAHPDAHPLLGGIAHLDKKTQENIRKANEVPPVECCNNPLFLYHMYQDSFISSEFKEFLYKSLPKTFTESEHRHLIKKWFFPYKVFNNSCEYNFQKRILYINWQSPFNAEGITDLRYSIFIRDEGGLFSRDISTEMRALQIEMPLGVRPAFEIWISAHCIRNSSKGPDVYIKCP